MTAAVKAVPAPVTEPVPTVPAFDLDAARAARREAGGQPFTFIFGGQTFTLPEAKEWPLTTIDAFSEGRVSQGMRYLLGDQWEAFAKVGGVVGDLESLFDALSAHQGLTPGE